ncbi:MAG: hypothetical protein AB1584_05085 [Pseudomonadota bacterium]
MEAKSDLPFFQFESADSLAQFSIWMIPTTGGGIVSIIAWDWGGWNLVAAVVLVCLLLILGLRSSITVRADQVKVVRKWFFVPYRTYTSPCIEEVSFGGDWGLDEGAMGVVVRMNGQDIHLGTSKNMHYLYESLREVAYTGRQLAHR